MTELPEEAVEAGLSERELWEALEKAAHNFDLVAKEILSLLRRNPSPADLAPAHSLAFCGAKDVRAALAKAPAPERTVAPPVLPDGWREEELRIHALGAAISRRDWHAVEQAHAAIRDKFHARLASAPMQEDAGR